MVQVSSTNLQENDSVATVQPSAKESCSGRRLIYLDLEQWVAIVRDNPAELSVEDDPKLKTSLHKFLGLIAPRRRLHYPIDHFDDEPENSSQKETILLTNLSSPYRKTPKRLFSRCTATTQTTTWTSLNPPTIEERQAKFCYDVVFRAHIAHIETQAPTSLKEPIDLSGLPSEEQRESICQRHKESIACLVQHPLFYGFVDSLNPQTSINMCHPQALTYRKTDFQSCKEALAKVLYDVFNHAIFHCGLQLEIVWTFNPETPCSSELGFNSSGHRTARILLGKEINHPNMLIKPLLHEMCHVAAFVFNGEAGHGENCRKWVYQSKNLIPELALITDCYAKYKYTCTLCAQYSYGCIAFEKLADRLRCHYCQFEVEVQVCDSDEVAHLKSRPNQLSSPFKNFVRENYVLSKNKTHSTKMQELNGYFMDRNLMNM